MKVALFRKIVVEEGFKIIVLCYEDEKKGMLCFLVPMFAGRLPPIIYMPEFSKQSKEALDELIKALQEAKKVLEGGSRG